MAEKGVEEQVLAMERLRFSPTHLSLCYSLISVQHLQMQWQTGFYFVTITFPSESRRGVTPAPYPDFQQR